jgi:AraC-like DNA-binding protein
MEQNYEEGKGLADPPHRHEYYTVIWVKEAKGRHLIDFKEYDLRKNQIFFIAPGQIHRIYTTEKPVGWVMTFHPDFLIESGIDPQFIHNINLFRQYSESPPIQLESDEILESVMELMLKFYDEEYDFEADALGASLKLFLIECIRQCDDPEIDGDKSCILVDFKKAVEKHYTINHKVSDYAEMLYISPKYLNEVIKSSIGTTAKEYIIDRILTESKRLLIHSDLTVKQIALNLGFSEPLHFNNFFKQRIRQTPLQFRLRMIR